MTYLAPLSPAEARQFVVVRNAHGYWVARDTHGLIEGVFTDRREAIRFALFEASDRSAVIAGGPEAATSGAGL